MAYVTTWEEIKPGDVILAGWPPEWRTVTQVTPASPPRQMRYIRAVLPDTEGYREYGAWDDILVTVKLTGARWEHPLDLEPELP